MAYYVPPSEKVGGHVRRVPHQIAPMSTTFIHHIPGWNVVVGKKRRGGRKDYFFWKDNN